MAKIWKSDGPETKQLEKLFREGKYNVNTKPGEVQQNYAVFNGFSPAVFRKHFGIAKERCCATNSSSGSAGMTLMDIMAKDHIDELDGFDGSSEPPEKKVKMEKAKTIEFVQPPIIPCVFTDPTTKQDKCLVVILLFNGVKGLNVDLINKDKGKEQTLVVKYNWPQEMYDVASMFKCDKDETMLAAATDPKLLAVDHALYQYRQNMEDAPVATIEIKLPVEVCTDPKSWNYKCNKKDDGNAIIFIELECLRKDYVISKTEKYIKIE